MNSRDNNNKQIEESSNLYNNINGSKLSNDSVEDSIDLNFINESEKIEEIQNIKFPDKVVMKQSNYNMQNFDLPKLDMSRVYQKYQLQNNLHIVKPIKKASQTKNKANLSLSKKLLENSTISKFENKFNNVKNELNHSREVVNNFENLLEEIKKIHNENKNKHMKINENLKIADSKIENLNYQIKQFAKKDINYDLVKFMICFFILFLINFLV
jgi:hypothetical protein